jgi:hypothetical protein
VLPIIGLNDAAAAAAAAAAALQPSDRIPAGCLSGTDVRGISWGRLRAAVGAGFRHARHPLHEGRWRSGLLFARSRQVSTAKFEAPDALDSGSERSHRRVLRPSPIVAAYLPPNSLLASACTQWQHARGVKAYSPDELGDPAGASVTVPPWTAVRSLTMVRASPVSGASRPMMIRIVVDFPAPFGPRKPVNWPGLTSKDKSSTARISL